MIETYRENDLEITPRVTDLNESHCKLVLEIKDSDLSEHRNVSFNLNTHQIIDQDDNSYLDFSNQENIFKFLLDFIKNYIKDSDLNRWQKGRIFYSLRKKNINLDFRQKEIPKIFIENNNLSEFVETNLDQFFLKEDVLDNLTYLKLKSRKIFDKVSLDLETYHLKEDIKIDVSKDVSLFLDGEIISSYSLGVNFEPLELFLTEEDSPLYSSEYKEFRYNQFLGYVAKDVIGEFKAYLYQALKNKYFQEEYTFNDLSSMDEIKEEGELSLRKESPLYRYYIKEEKVLIKEFDLHTGEWNFQ